MISPKQFIRDTGFRPSRMLGQNFLVHKESAIKILNWAGAKRGDTVLEIGPGLGAMTEALSEAGCNVIAIEKDSRLFQNLAAIWKDEKWLTLHHGDALILNLAEKIPSSVSKAKVIANLPYSVSTPILEKLLECSEKISDMTLLLQEEMVDRICAIPGIKNYGRLSIWIQILCETQRGPKIPKGSFHPVPEVESRLVRLTPRTSPLVQRDELEPFLEFVSKLFRHRRKTIRKILNDLSFESPVETKIGQQRPEDLSWQELFGLFQESIV